MWYYSIVECLILSNKKGLEKFRPFFILYDFYKQSKRFINCVVPIYPIRMVYKVTIATHVQKGNDNAGSKAAARVPSKTCVKGFASMMFASQGDTECNFIQGNVDPPRYHKGNIMRSQVLFIVWILLVNAVVINEKYPKNRLPSVKINPNFHQQK